MTWTLPVRVLLCFRLGYWCHSRLLSPMASHEIHDFLNHQSTSEYFIEYQSFVTNHLSHWVIALHRLQATRPRLESCVKGYIPKLDTDDDRPVENLRGERISFYRILQHYETLLKEKYNSNTDELIKGEYPKVSAGLAGSALHGMIHLGYSYSIGQHKRHPRRSCLHVSLVSTGHLYTRLQY